MAATDQCRDVKELNILVRIMLKAALKEIRAEGVEPLVVETYRSLERQYYLYGQGRSVAQCASAGMPLSKARKYAKPGANKVTWTLDSIHIKRKAVDVIPVRNGKVVWDSNDRDTKKIIRIMRQYGFEAGANWKTSPDSPHFQVKGNFNTVFSESKSTVYVTMTVQTALKALGFYSGAVDGSWGAATAKAVNRFQKANGWKLTGKIGKTALKKLLKSIR